MIQQPQNIAILQQENTKKNTGNLFFSYVPRAQLVQNSLMWTYNSLKYVPPLPQKFDTQALRVTLNLKISYLIYSLIIFLSL